MLDQRWNKVIQRIIGEANWKNGKTRDAVVKVNISVVVQNNSPLLWEVINASKIEPAMDVIENLAGFTVNLKKLSDKCESPTEINRVLKEAIDKL